MIEGVNQHNIHEGIQSLLLKTLNPVNFLQDLIKTRKHLLTNREIFHFHFLFHEIFGNFENFNTNSFNFFFGIELDYFVKGVK